MKQYKYYFLAYAAFLICLFTSPYVYAFFDFHISDAYEHYDLERRGWERDNPGETEFMSFGQWQQMDNEKDAEWLDYLGDSVAVAFDPWYESKYNNESR